MTTFYRQDPNMFRVCVNCHKARGSHTWSEGQKELLCIEPPSKEMRINMLEEALRKLLAASKRVQDETSGDIYTDAPECEEAIEDLHTALGEMQTAMDEAIALFNPAV
jgi:hypothetical protein